MVMPNILFYTLAMDLNHVYQRGHYLSIAFLNALTGQENLQDKSLYHSVYLCIFEDRNCAVLTRGQSPIAKGKKRKSCYTLYRWRMSPWVGS
jgi:hypothetical protein